VLDYYLKSPAQGEVQIGIYDQKGQLVRQLSSKAEEVRPEEPPPVPNYWLYHSTPLPTNAGMNRYVWDLRYSAPEAIQHTYPISALYERTHAEPQGPFVVPGTYEVRLTVDGKTYKQPLTVEMDPRVKITQAELQQQLQLGQQVDKLISMSYGFHQQAATFLQQVSDRQSKLQNNGEAKPALDALNDLQAKAEKLQGQVQHGFGGFGKPKPTFTLVNGTLSSFSETINQADQAPTPAMQVAYQDYCKDLGKVAQQWSDLMKQQLPAVNTQLTQHKLQPIAPVLENAAVPGCQ
jgi:hypothetical protein